MRSHAKASAAGSKQRRATGLGRTGTAFACLLALLAFGGIGASAALAGQTRVPVPGISPLAEPETADSTLDPITDPRGIAIDEASGNVFVNDAGTHTEILGADGGPPAGLVSPYLATSGCDASRNGIAVDNSSSAAAGTVYVVCTEGKIRRLVRNPATETYEPAPGGEISYPGSFSAQAGATVDANGNLFVSDFESSIYKFDPAGTLIKTFNFASPNPIVRPGGLAVDSVGDLFIQRSGSGQVFKCPADAFGEINPSTCTQFIASGATGVAVDRTADTLFVSFIDRVAQYDATTLAKELEFGAGTFSNTFPNPNTMVAVNSATDRIYVSNRSGDKDQILVFGSPVPVPTVTTNAASDITGTKATLNGTVNPEGLPVSECFFEYGPTTAYGSSKPCEGAIPTDSSNHPVTAAIAGLTPNGATYHFRIVAKNANGTERGADRTLVTATTVTTNPASNVTTNAATLNGTVRPEGAPLIECKFEYGTTNTYGSSKPCTPAAGAIDADFEAHAVAANLSALANNTTYHFRLSVTNAAGTVNGADQSFTTVGPPLITQLAATDVDQSTATLRARINPSSFATNYHFEWGTDASYGNRVPAGFDLFAGSGNSPIAVSANLSGLQETSSYHFRLVATNSAGTTATPDQVFTTLNAAGLPNDRRFELVSPPDKRPQGAVTVSEVRQSFVISQVAEDGQSVAFPLLGGTEGTDSGGDASYLARRSAEGWQSAKISPPSLVPAPTNGVLANAASGAVVFNSPDLSCSVIHTFNPLTEDTPVADVELGVYNLYVRHQDGSHTLITNRVPANPEIEPVSGLGLPVTTVAGASEDCSKVYFKSQYKFLPDPSGLYEWDEGTLRDAGRLPDGARPTGTFSFGGPIALGGEYGAAGSRLNSVSPDGSRFFFTAQSSEPATAGRIAVFMREEGAPTVEISAKGDGAGHSLGSRYEVASRDGSHVFFTASYGLTADSSSGPAGNCSDTTLGSLEACDLYDYDVESGELANLSADSNPADSKGAVVQGVIAVSADGSSVYFAARGQLVDEQGKTYAENIAGAGSANVYLARNGQLSYVGEIALPPVPLADNTGDAGALVRALAWTAEATPDGEHLLFPSSARVSDYDSGGKSEAYLYSAQSGKTRCVSCRPDGQPPTTAVSLILSFARSEARQRLSRKMSEDGSRIFFTRSDVLAPGAVLGNNNLYEWERGQIHLLATGGPFPEFLDVDFESLEFYGTSKSGDDVFFSTPAQLSPHDTDFVKDIYDARVGGGFPPPPAPRIPCNPAADECQGTLTPQPGAPSPGSVGFSGPGNVSTPPKSPCAARARRAGKLSKRAKVLQRQARRASNPKAKRQFGRGARRAAKAARRNSRAAKRCRRARAANNNRGGAK